MNEKSLAAFIRTPDADVSFELDTPERYVTIKRQLLEMRTEGTPTTGEEGAIAWTAGKVSEYASRACELYQFRCVYEQENPQAILEEWGSGESMLVRHLQDVFSRDNTASLPDVDTVRLAYQQEDEQGGLHTMCKLLLDAPEAAYRTHDVIDFLKMVRECETGVELLKSLDREKGLDERVYRAIFNKVTLIGLMGSEIGLGRDKSAQEFAQLARGWCAGYYRAMYPDLSDDLIDRLAFYSSREVTAEWSPSGVLKRFTATIDTIDTIGTETAQELFETCGLTMFGAYSLEQLARTYEVFCDNDTQEIERLQAVDTRVVFINSAGDHNGALGYVPDTYDISSNVLFFEVEKFEDIYAGFVQLRRRGIRPSSLVLAQHARAGQLVIRAESEPDGSIYRQSYGMHSVPTEEVDEHSTTVYSVRKDANGFSRLMSDRYMQPSAKSGEKQVILHGCRLAGEVQRSKDGATSFLDDFAQLVPNEECETNVYGFEEAVAIDRHDEVIVATTSGETDEKPLWPSDSRVDCDAVKVSVRGGKRSKSTVSEIPLQ